MHDLCGEKKIFVNIIDVIHVYNMSYDIFESHNEVLFYVYNYN